MLVGTQALQPSAFNHHLNARAHRKSARKRSMLAGLMLTSMVDMFSLLVIFLLQAFSASPELLVMSKGVQLPVATSGRELKDAPVLSLSTKDVYLDQKRVGSTEEVLANPEGLMLRLSDLRSLWQKSHPGATFPGELNVQAHRELSANTVSKFMTLLPSQNYSSIQLAVISSGGP